MGWYETLKDAARAAQAADNLPLLKELNAALEEGRQLEAKLASATAEIEGLRRALMFKGTLELRDNLLWAEGDPVPFCRLCYESDGKALHLNVTPPAHYHCHRCKNGWNLGKSPESVRIRPYL